MRTIKSRKTDMLGSLNLRLSARHALPGPSICHDSQSVLSASSLGLSHLQDDHEIKLRILMYLSLPASQHFPSWMKAFVSPFLLVGLVTSDDSLVQVIKPWIEFLGPVDIYVVKTRFQ